MAFLTDERDDEEEEREVDEKRRELLKKAGLGAGAAALGGAALGYGVGSARAYDPNSRTVYGENIQNLDAINDGNYSASDPLELRSVSPKEYMMLCLDSLTITMNTLDPDCP